MEGRPGPLAYCQERLFVDSSGWVHVITVVTCRLSLVSVGESQRFPSVNKGSE
jgi:hypothetical protein